MFYTSRRIKGDEAVEWGLADVLAPVGEERKVAWTEEVRDVSEGCLCEEGEPLWRHAEEGLSSGGKGRDMVPCELTIWGPIITKRERGLIDKTLVHSLSSFSMLAI